MSKVSIYNKNTETSMCVPYGFAMACGPTWPTNAGGEISGTKEQSRCQGGRKCKHVPVRVQFTMPGPAPITGGVYKGHMAQGRFHPV